MYEHKRQRVLSRARYFHRQAKHAAIALGIVAISLAAGATGYRVVEHMTWIDAVYSAALILTGMGPAVAVKTDGGKLFVTAYSLFSGVVFLSASSVVLAPMVHRMLHRLHVEDVA